VIFRAFSWWFSWSIFEAYLFGIWWGMYAWTLCGSFPFDSRPPKLAIKGARFWGFRCSRVRGVLGKISSIPLDLASFGGPNLSYGVPMRCSCYPQSLVQIRWAIWEIRSWIWGSWPAGAAHPKSSGHTSLTDADSCWVLLRWTSGWVLCSPVLLLFQVWVSLELGRPVW
jgi:hypothetical protein